MIYTHIMLNSHELKRLFFNSPEMCHMALINFRKWSEIYRNDMNQWRVINLERAQIIFMYLISLFGSKYCCTFLLRVIIIWQYYQTPLLLLLVLKPIADIHVTMKTIFALFILKEQAYSLEFDLRNYCSLAFKKGPQNIWHM